MEDLLLWPGGPVLRQAPRAPLGTDTVLLADFVRADRARRGLDLGCASGAIALLLLSRLPGLHMTGLELQREAAEIARENMERNGFTGRSQILWGDLRDHRTLLKAGSFDLVVSNPPYFPVGSGAASPDPGRELARSESGCSLEELCRAAAWSLRTGGSFCLVHRPERLSELFCVLTAQGLEPKRLRLVCPRPAAGPSLVLVEGRRGGKPGLEIQPPLLLRDGRGEESREYRRIYHRLPEADAGD